MEQNTQKIANRIVNQEVYACVSELVGALWDTVHSSNAFADDLLELAGNYVECELCSGLGEVYLPGPDDCESCPDCDGEGNTYREAFEHWIVSGWLAEKLRGVGEKVVNLRGSYVWARTTTGQMICADWCIEEIARAL